jgi:phosphomannomutase
LKDSDSVRTAATLSDTQAPVDSVHFGTDGWRAIIGEDFNVRSAARVAAAAARVFKRQKQAGERYVERADGQDTEQNPEKQGPGGESSPTSPTIIVGYDCRQDAGRYAALVATVVAAHGFDVIVSDRYCPTPTLCWTVARNPHAVGGVMLTSSHNPAEYLGIKLRMADGGASPADFTDEVEAELVDEVPACFEEALANFAVAQNGTPSKPATAPQAPFSSADASPPDASPKDRPLSPPFRLQDIMAPYLASLTALVDRSVIEKAGLRVVVDPLFGAGRGYLAELLRQLGVEVTEVNGEQDPSFNGLHPEPILPWVRTGAAKVAEGGYGACFVTDGDADRIGAIDDTGAYVSSHRVLALLIGHLVEDRGQTGRVIRTRAGSNLLRRQCDRLGLALTTKPIGFKWIYEEMLKGDVLIGGEESGGIGIPSHVRERDGLLMALLLAELMAQKGKKLHELVDDLLATLGTLEYARRDLRLTPEQKAQLLATHVNVDTLGTESYQELFSPLDETLVAVSSGDGIKFELASDSWLLVRPSGTEPLVRVYAEAPTDAQVESLLNLGCALAQGGQNK